MAVSSQYPIKPQLLLADHLAHSRHSINRQMPVKLMNNCLKSLACPTTSNHGGGCAQRHFVRQMQGRFQMQPTKCLPSPSPCLSTCPLKPVPSALSRSPGKGGGTSYSVPCSPTASLDLSRDSHEQQGPSSSSTWPRQCMLINYPNDNNSSTGSSLRPSSRRPQVATPGETPAGLSDLDGRGLKSQCSLAFCQFPWVLWVGSRTLS